MVKYAMPDDRLSLIFGALADPTRRAILSRLIEGEASVNELAAPFAMSLPAISKTLRCSSMPGSLPAVAMPSGARAGLSPRPSRRSTPGLITSAHSGTRTLSDSTVTCGDCRCLRSRNQHDLRENHDRIHI